MNSTDRSRNSEESKYKGVRKRKWGKWVSEIRLPHSRDRIWLGSYDSPVKAARAFDAAQFCLRGASASFNFPDSPPHFAGADSFSPAEIQAAASRFANGDDDDRPPPPPVEEAAPTTDDDSPAAVQWQSGPFYYNDYDLMAIDSGSGYGYGAEFGFGSGSSEVHGAQQPDSLDYGYDNWNGSGTQGSFLWNF